MEDIDLKSKTKDELISIIKQLTKKSIDVSDDPRNKRKRESSSMDWPAHAGRRQSFPVEIENHDTVDPVVPSNVEHTPIVARRGKLPSPEEHLRLARVIVEEMYQFCSLLDANGNILLTNTPALRGAGLNLIDIVGRPFWEARWWQVSPENQNRLQQALQDARAGNFVRYETAIYGGDEGQNVIWVDFSLVAVYEPGPNGKSIIFYRTF